MGRPKINRIIRKIPKVRYFKPRGIPITDLSEEILTMDEMESLRLKHYFNQNQIDSAKKMNISQSTFSRILESAHKKITCALIEGKAIKLFGGNYDYKRLFLGYGCLSCKYEWEKQFEENFDLTHLSDNEIEKIHPIPTQNSVNCPECKSLNVYRLIKNIKYDDQL